MTQLVTTRPQFLNANSLIYNFWDIRSGDESAPGPGVADYESFRVMQRQAGATMSVDIGKTAVGLQRAWVRGSTRGGQGLYLVDSIDRTAPTADTYLAQFNDTITANASGLPRLDQVILEVLDQQHVGASSLAQIRVVPGVGTAAADLDTRNGAAALPASSILLADVIVANGAASIVTANIRDRRARPLPGDIPGLLTAVDQVGFAIPSQLFASTGPLWAAGGQDNQQLAVLMYLPRRIVGPTRLRWKYLQGATANAGSYNIAICDASGRLIVATGAVAATGAANSYQERSEVIAATTFEAGAYYVWTGLGAMTASSQMIFEGISPAPSNQPLVPARNLALRLATGGTTFPATNNILGYADAASLSATVLSAVPYLTLSVG
jgi:hypothetical protein